MLRKLFTLLVCLMAAVATASAQTPPYNEIWYTTTDGRPLFINSGYKESVGLYMYSDTYNNGRGVLEFKSGGYINFIKSGLFNGKDRLKSITIPNSVTRIGDYAFSGCSNLTSITIPNSVTEIGRYAFQDCSSLTSITIPDSVTYIGKWAFKGCSSLTSITIPNSVTSIGEWAFYGCSSLTSITIPNSVTSIGRYAFAYCSSLKSITIGNSVTEIGNSAFTGCSSLKSFNGKYASSDGRCLIIDGKLIKFAPAGLTSYTIPNSVTSIGWRAFEDCSSLTSITIPNSVTEIGIGAFHGCSSLTSITIPNSVTSIGEGAFRGCSSLTSITIPNSVTSIGDGAFAWCSSLTSITIPNSVTSIGEEAFRSCSSLTSITIPNSVTSIGRYAFYDCSGLTSITIGNSVTSIDSWAFEGCSRLKSVQVSNKYCYYYFKDKVDDIAFYRANASDDGRCLIVNGELKQFIAKGITEYTIPESVTSIVSGTFDGCSSLTSITIPNSVTSIGRYAFSGCSSLKSVKVANKYCYDYFKDKVANIAFYGANASADGRCLIVNGELQRFIGKGITEYTISESVTSIGDYAFSGCSSLTSITCLATTPPAIDDLSIAETTMIYVPKEAVKAYKKDPKWSRYKKQIKAIK